MLEVQKFIMNNPDWENILSAEPFAINIARKDNLIRFKYNQCKSDFSSSIVQECRGLILEDKTFKVVAYAFKKFFNYGETNAVKIDWNTAKVTEKVDGSIIKVYYYNGWRVATNSTIDAEDAELQSPLYKNYRELFDAAARNSRLDFSKLNPNYCYVMELCSCFNQIVVPYGEPQLFHLTTRDMTTLEEVEVDINIEKPRQYRLSSLDDCVAMAKTFDFTQEGFVACDANRNRIKIKSPSYLQAHYLLNNKNVTFKTAIDTIRKGEEEEFLTYFPRYKNYFHEVQTRMDILATSINFIHLFVSSWKDAHSTDDAVQMKKDFAATVKGRKDNPLYFLAYNQNLNDWYMNLSTDDYIRKFSHHFDNITIEIF